jgi:hypothetical protein
MAMGGVRGEQAGVMDGVVLELPDTLHGQLQRGRGAGRQRAVTAPGGAELVYDCIRRDARQDHQVESRPPA